jgi:hypothetical protein
MLMAAFTLPVNSSEDAAIFINPSSIKGPHFAPSTYITIAVLVANVSDLSVATFNVSYEPLILSFRSFSLGELPHGPLPTFQTSDVIGFFWLNVTYTTPITTSLPRALINITFLILGKGQTVLDLHDTQLLDSSGQQIPHIATGSYFSNFNPYDINKDGKIDILDLGIVAQAFGSYPGHPRWNADADVNDDGYVDLIDVAIVAAHFGEY